MEIKFIENTELQEKPLNPPAFGQAFTDYMFIMDYNNEQGWHDARLVPTSKLEYHPAMFTLHYAVTIFEGLKAYQRPNNEMILYRPKDNFIRLNKSAQRLAMPTIDEDFLYKALLFHLSKEKRWLYDDPRSAIYIRPFMFASEEFVGIHDPASYRYMVIMSPVGPYFDGDVALKVEEELTRSVAGGMGEAKTGGNYAASMLATKQAAKDGFKQVIWLDGIEKKYIEEAGVMNIFVVMDNVVYTPETNGTILRGITRDSSIKYLKDLGYEVKEEKIAINDVVEAYKQGNVSEIFATGTAATIMPINKVTYRDTDMLFKYTDNSISSILLKHFNEIRNGVIEDKHNHVILIK